MANEETRGREPAYLRRYLWWLLVDAATAAALVGAWIQVWSPPGRQIGWVAAAAVPMALVGAWVDAAWWPRTIAAVRGTR